VGNGVREPRWIMGIVWWRRWYLVADWSVGLTDLTEIDARHQCN
jgi:hypothetical protein